MECFRVFLVRSSCVSLQHHRPSARAGPQHYLHCMLWGSIVAIICTACSTLGMISSLLRIISCPAAGIKPLHISRSTTKNSGTIKPSQIAWSNTSNGSADLKMVLHVLLLTAQRNIVPVGTMLQKDNTLYSNTDC